MQPLVTVVVPVYNTKAEFLDKCIYSILHQNYSHLELIIVDDGSRTETACLCDHYGQLGENIFVYHIENSGASVARNLGIKKSKGEYITFVDSDDWLEANYLQQMMSAILEESTDIVMCTRSFEYKSRTIEDHFFNQSNKFTKKNKKELIKKSLLSGVAGTWCKIYRKIFLIDNNLSYNTDLRRTQDIIFNLYAFQYAKTVRYIDLPLYHYRMQNESVTKKYNLDADVILTKAAFAFNEYVKKYYSQDSEILQAYYYKCVNILNEIVKLKLFNVEYKKSFAEKVETLRILCQIDVYKEAIKKVNFKSYKGIYSKMRIFCLKAKLYPVLYFPYVIKSYAERWENFK